MSAGPTLLARSIRCVWSTRASFSRTTRKLWPRLTSPITASCTATSRNTPRGRCPQVLARPTRCTWRWTWGAWWYLCSCSCCPCSGTSSFSTVSSSPLLPPPLSWALPFSLVSLRLGFIVVNYYESFTWHIHLACIDTCTYQHHCTFMLLESRLSRVCWRLRFQERSYFLYFSESHQQVYACVTQ